MHLAVRSIVTALLLATLAVSSTYTSMQTMSSQASQASSSFPESSSETVSPIITFISYVTISNSTIPVNPVTIWYTDIFSDYAGNSTLIFADLW